MRAMLLSAPLTLEIVEQPDPVIERDDDVIVRVRAASICGSDTHGYDGKNGRRVAPLVMGHEASGEVVAVGSAVTAVKPGDRVFVMPMHWCGTCDACVHGQFDLCPQRKVYGGDLPGAFAELFRVSERTAIPIPDEVTFRQAALIEPLAVVVKGLSRAKFDAGDSAAVIGGGPIGLIATAVLALHRPHQLIVMEPLAARREIARQMGATLVLDPTQDGAMEALMEATDGLGADLTVEAVGSTASVAFSGGCHPRRRAAGVARQRRSRRRDRRVQGRVEPAHHPRQRRRQPSLGRARHRAHRRRRGTRGEHPLAGRAPG